MIVSLSLHSCKSVATSPLFGELALLPFWDLKAFPDDVLQVNESIYAYTASFITVYRWIDIVRLYILMSLYPYDALFGRPAIFALLDRLFQSFPLCGYGRCVSIALGIPRLALIALHRKASPLRLAQQCSIFQTVFVIKVKKRIHLPCQRPVDSFI